MKIDLTMGQLVAICEYLGYKQFMPATEGYIETETNQLVMFGAECPIEHKLPTDCTFEAVSLADDKWRVVPKTVNVPIHVIDKIREAFRYFGEEAGYVVNQEAMTETDVEYCQKGIDAMKAAIKAFPALEKDYKFIKP